MHIGVIVYYVIHFGVIVYYVMHIGAVVYYAVHIHVGVILYCVVGIYNAVVKTDNIFGHFRLCAIICIYVDLVFLLGN